MSQVRVHNFSVSLDGFGTGEGLTFDAPFGHAGHRLHEWVFPTHFGRSIIMGQPGGTVGMDNAFAERLDAGFGAEIMGRGKFGPQTGPWTELGGDDEWRGWWGSNPPFHTPVFVPDAPCAPVHRNGGRHGVPLCRRFSTESSHPCPGGRRRPRRAHRRGTYGRPRVPRCRPHRHDACCRCTNPSRARCAVMGWPRRH